MNDLSMELPVNEIGTGLQLQVKLSDSRLLTFNAAIRRDASLGDHNQLVDKLLSVAERQERKFLLEDLEKALLFDEEGKRGAEEAMLSVDERCEAEWARKGKHGKPKLTDSEQAAKMAAATNIERFKTEIKKKKIAIAELKEKIAKDV